MKRLYFVICTLILFSIAVYGGDDNVNVLGYYAVNNSLDGQPMVDMVNVLRFYPVFAMRDSTDAVHVTIYYGGNIFERYADKMDDGKYWQVLLPIFRLGDAIQRLEIKEHLGLSEVFKYRYLRIVYDPKYEIVSQLKIRVNELNKKIQFLKDSLQIFQIKPAALQGTGTNRHSVVSNMGGQLYGRFRIGYNPFMLADIYEADPIKYNNLIDSLINFVPSDIKINGLVSLKKDIASFLSDWQTERKKLDADDKEYSNKLKSITDTINIYSNKISSYTDSISLNEGKIRQLETDTLNIEYAMEKMKLRSEAIDSLVKEIQYGLTDTMFSGPSVRKSDIIIDSNFTGASILYRNYKQGLRHLVALDPGERLGIFRVRYVPFPVTRTPDKQSTSLRGPFNNNFTVFEVGLTFGDAIVSGDDFIVPEFSWNRLGVAFAITEKLFSDSAQVIGLALTYDFNSYGSVGVGGNFAQHEAHPYFSFGINKKAFEAVLSGLAGIFK